MNGVQKGRINSINIAAGRGRRKTPAGAGLLIAGYGMDGDTHAGSGHRQVSLLAVERIKVFNERREISDGPGDFAENITTEGIDWEAVSEGAIIMVGPARLRVSSKGKPEHGPGDCSFEETPLLAAEGVFAEVLDSGFILVGDSMAVYR